MIATPKAIASNRIDKSQVQQQLTALGYKQGDTVYLRSFYPSDDPRKAEDKGRKTEAKNLDKLIQLAAQFQAEGRGVYMVVNGGGHLDENVNMCRSIFYEHDNLDKQLQVELWRSIGLPEPSLQVDSGGKSIHSYWIFDQPCTVEQWRSLQTDLLEHADADRSLKNPSRVMRLAGCWHFAPNNIPNSQSQIILNSGKRYSYQDLRENIPTKKTAATAPRELELPTGDVPLYQCLSKDDRALIDSSTGQGERNDKGAKLARNLIGTAARLTDLGYRYFGNPRTLFDDYCSRCSPPLDVKEADLIWKSAEKDNPTATLTDDALENCVKAWQRGQQSRRSPQPSNVIPHPTAARQPLSRDELVKEIRLVLNQSLSTTGKKAAFLELAKNLGCPVREIEEIAQSLEAEIELDESRADHKAEIEGLLKLGEGNLNLSNYLPQALAIPLTQYCQWLNIRPETVLLALLSTTSSLHQVGTELIIHKAQGFAVPPTIMAAMVAESGQKKSPITRQIISKPLAVLKEEAIEVYNSNLEQYQIDLEDWEERKASTPKGEKFTEPKPVDPAPPTIFYFTDANGEGIKQQAQKAPNKALFALVDELAGFFNSADKYRGGRGSDKQDLLSYYDGTGQTVLRSSGVKVDVKRIYLSVFGTIQPGVIHSIMRNCEDPDGQWARFLYVQQPLTASVLSDDDGSGVDIVDLLAGIYRQLHNTQARQYTLSRDAFKVYQQYYNKLEQMRVTHPNPGMRATYSKAEGYTGRLALNLHVLHELSTSRCNLSTEIPASRMREAIALMNFFIGQTKLLYSTFDEGIAPHITKMIELSKARSTTPSLGWLKAKDVQLSFNTKSRPKPDVVRSWMREAEALGFGSTRGAGIKLEFCWQSQKVDQVDFSRPKVDLPSTAAPLEIQDFHKKVDTVDNYSSLQKTTTTEINHVEKVDINLEQASTVYQNSCNEDLVSNLAVDTQSTWGSTKSEESTFFDEAVPAATPSVYAPKPEFKKGDKVQFVKESDRQWYKGTVESIEMDRGYFVKAVIGYWAFGKSRQEEIYRDDWLKHE